jgi:hypothetical protein
MQHLLAVVCSVSICFLLTCFDRNDAQPYARHHDELLVMQTCFRSQQRLCCCIFCCRRDLAALNMFPTAAIRRRNMDASYTALLLCCRVYGTSHPRTREALEDTRVTDPQGWVPLLLAGMAYPSVTRAPGVVKGSKAEAEVRSAQLYNCALGCWQQLLLLAHIVAAGFGGSSYS